MEATMNSPVCRTRSLRDQFDNTISFSQEELMPIVRKCFQRFCDLHWSMLASGTLDTSTLAALSDVVSDITQILAAETVRVVVQICSHATNVLSPISDTFSVSLENSFSQSIASALGLPEEKTASVESLREMVESEVSEKVNSVISLVMNSPVLPPEPVIYVSSSKPPIRKLRHMVHHAAACLRSYAAKISTTCHRPLNDSSDLDESTESLKSNMSSLAAISSVKDILNTWATEPLGDEHQRVPTHAVNSPESQKVASEIVETIASDLHYCETEKGSASSNKSATCHFNMGFITDNVRSFIATQSPVIKDTASRKVRERRHFFKVAKRQFDKMVTDLKSAFKRKDPEFLVDLRIKSATTSTVTPTALVRTSKSKTPVDFKSITPDILKLLAKTLQEVMSSGEIQKFSRELTDKMYDHLMVDGTYQIPVPPQGKRLSDFVLSNTGLQVSPEVLYAMTEDLVEKFVQSLMLFKEEPLDGHSEEVSGALADIEVLVSKIATPSSPPSHITAGTESKCISSVDKSSEERVASVPVHLFFASKSPVSSVSKLALCEVPEASKKPSTKLAGVTSAPSHITAGTESKCISGVDESSERRVASVPVHLFLASKSSASGKTINLIASPKHKAKRSSVLLLRDTDKIKTPVKESSIKQQKEESDVESGLSVTKAINSVFLKVMKTFLLKCKQQVTIEVFQAILTRVSELPLDDINVSSAEIMRKSEKICKGMVKALHKEFGSADEVMQAAQTSEDPSFDDALVKILKIQLKLIPRPGPKSFIASIFSAVGSVLLEAFRRCSQR